MSGLSSDFQKAAPTAEPLPTVSVTKTGGKRITLRLTDEEYQRLTTAAEGVSVSAYVRKSLFGKHVTLRKTRARTPVENEKALAAILAKLGDSRIANNLNQIAYHSNCGSLLLDEQTDCEIKEACARIAWIRTQLIEALGLKAQGR